MVEFKQLNSAIVNTLSLVIDRIGQSLETGSNSSNDLSAEPYKNHLCAIQSLLISIYFSIILADT